MVQLSKDLVVFDLETTGTWIEKDRIIEIAMIKCKPDGSQEVYHEKVNPGMPIPPVVSELTGITNEDVKDAPPFKHFAKDVVAFIGDSDLGGFNVDRFDLPLLARELSANGVQFSAANRKVFDAQKVYHINERRDLSAAVRFYCGKELEDAHSALADTQATVDVLMQQVERYDPESQAMDALLEYEYKPTSEFIDSERKLRIWNGEIYMMFGKYAKKESLRVIAQKDPGYLEWILGKDFSGDVKQAVEDALKGYPPNSI